jgi:hypothetical protein
MYNLYPPFLIVPEETDFADVWESFCCKLLQLKEHTDSIVRLGAPEGGIDLYDAKRSIAYQCKGVESGKRGDFNVNHAISSIQAALAKRREREWKKYVVCTNVDITGPAFDKLRRLLSEVDIRPRSYWINACERFPDAVQRNFRLLLTIPRERLVAAQERVLGTTHIFGTNVSEQLRHKLSECPYDIFLYSNKHETLYRLQVSASITIQDLDLFFRGIFQLPSSYTLRDLSATCVLTHEVIFEGEPQTDSSRSLKEAGITENSIVMFRTHLTYWNQQEPPASFRTPERSSGFSAVIFHSRSAPLPVRLSGERLQIAQGRVADAIANDFKRSDASLKSLVHGD